MKKTKMLKKNYEFRKVLSKGTYYSGEYLEIFLLQNKKLQNLLGIAISTKIGKAVKRNKLKRLIRENYKNFESNLKTGQSIVILWKKKKSIEEATFSNIEKDMNRVFDKAGILIEK